MSLRSNRYATLVTRILTLTIYACMCAACWPSPARGVEDPFEIAVGAKLDSRLRLVPESKQIKAPEGVGYGIENLTAGPVYFPDYTFGIRAYTLDPQSQVWVLYPWDFKVIHTQTVTVLPGPLTGLNNVYALGLSSFPSSGKVRLVVVGWTDPHNPEGSKIAAYADIEIVK